MKNEVNSEYEKMLAEANPYDLFIRYRGHPELLWQAMTVRERQEWDCTEEEYGKGYRFRATLIGLAALVCGFVVAGLIIGMIVYIY